MIWDKIFRKRNKKKDISLAKHKLSNCSRCNSILKECKNHLGLCEKCYYLLSPGISQFVYYSNLFPEWRYIIYDSIQKKGVDWYIVARDKLITKLESIKEKAERKNKIIDKKIVESIERW